MALRDYLVAICYVGFVTLLGLFLAPDPTGIAPLAVALAGGLVASHALARVGRPARLLTVSAGATLGLTVLTSVSVPTVGANLPAVTLVSTIARIGVVPTGYALAVAVSATTDESGGADGYLSEV